MHPDANEVIICSIYDAPMIIQNEGEADALARQVMLVYASNKRAAVPFRIALCGIPRRADPPSTSQEDTAQPPVAQQVLLLRLEALNFRSWGPTGWVSWHEDDPWDVFADRTLLYLRCNKHLPSPHHAQKAAISAHSFFRLDCSCFPC